MSTCGRPVIAVHSVAATVTFPRCDEAPVPNPGRGPQSHWELRVQRQRIDMTRPMIIAPKPMAKFPTPSFFMNPMRSPAT